MIHPRFERATVAYCDEVQARDNKDHLMTCTRAPKCVLRQFGESAVVVGPPTDAAIEKRIRKLGIGQNINTSHMERLNGTIRGQQARLARRTRNGSHLEQMLQYSIWLWRDLYNWTRVHYSLLGETPAMALGLTTQVWTVLKYILYPVHVSDLQCQDWAEQRNSVLESAVDVYKRNKALPIS